MRLLVYILSCIGFFLILCVVWAWTDTPAADECRKVFPHRNDGWRVPCVGKNSPKVLDYCSAIMELRS